MVVSIFPALFLASFTFNFLVNSTFTSTELFSDVGLQYSLMASGVMLQGIIGSAIMRYWLGNPFHQWKNLKTLYFVFIIAFLVSLISANIGISSISYFNSSFPSESYWTDVIFWWLGDALCVLLTTPFLLSLLNFYR